MRFRLIVDGDAHELEVEGRAPNLTVRVDGASYRTRVAPGQGELAVRVGSGRHRVVIRGSQVFVDGLPHEVAAESFESTESYEAVPRGGPGARLEVRPPMPGRVVKVLVAQGDAVKRGQTLVVLEAMKMQNEIPAPADASVREVRVREGESIPADRVTVVLETR